MAGDYVGTSKYRDDGNGLYWDGTPEEEQAWLNDPVRVTKELVDAVQNHLDQTARQRNYDGILSLCSYATSTNPTFNKEGQAGVEWRDDCWAYCYQVQADIQSELRPVPTAEELIAELPEFTWGD